MRVHSCSAAVLLAAVVCSCALGCQRPVEYRTFASPDGRFEVVVCRIPTCFATPGQASDAPGLVRLRDVRTGRVAAACRVEMVQLVEQVEWTDTSVTVGRLADWKLPREAKPRFGRYAGSPSRRFDSRPRSHYNRVMELQLMPATGVGARATDARSEKLVWR